MTDLLTFGDFGVKTYLISQLLLIGIFIVGSKFFQWENKSTFKFSLAYYLIGLAVGLGSSIVLINWESYNSEKIYTTKDFDSEDDFVIPTSAQIKPDLRIPKPKTPEVKKRKIISQINISDDIKAPTIEFKDEPLLDLKPAKGPKLPDVKPPVVAPIIEDNNDEPILVPDQMPRFPGCESTDLSREARSKCAAGKLLEYIYDNLKYPTLARVNDIEGLVVIRFVVNKKGLIDNISILKDIGAGCGKAAESVVKSMNLMDQKWTPGLQKGRPVNVIYTLPVKFKLSR